MHRIFANKMEQRRINVAAWLFLLAGLMVSMQVSAVPAGRLLFARGVVEVLHEGVEPHRVIRGDMINVGDTIRTGAKASAQIRLTDGAMIALRSGTLFKIEQQIYNKDKPEENSQVATLLRGGLRAITGAIGHERHSAVKISTPVATIGIRGTVYDTVYVPPEGLPGLPDVPPGHYTMVLEGRVSLSNKVGELLLGVGEIGYVADPNTPPVLRPDLSWLFAKYATLHEDDGGGDDTNDTGDVGPTITPIDDQLTQTAVPSPVKPGPYALMVASDMYTTYQGAFVSNVVTIGSSGELTYADGGTGDLSLFDNNGVSLSTTPGSATAGDSTINWGSYTISAVAASPIVKDASGNDISITSGNVDYIYATQVMTTIADLPTTGVFTYNYAGGSGTMLDSNSNLVVDFGNSTMNVDLVVGSESYTASNKSISSFYGSGVALDNSTYGAGSTIKGRFVGSNADGAITTFELMFDGNYTGTAAFAR